MLAARCTSGSAGQERGQRSHIQGPSLARARLRGWRHQDEPLAGLSGRCVEGPGSDAAALALGALPAPGRRLPGRFPPLSSAGPHGCGVTNTLSGQLFSVSCSTNSRSHLQNSSLNLFPKASYCFLKAEVT